MSFFSGFPIEPYNFGNEVDFSFIQNLTAYVDIIDSVKDQVTFYESYEILENERPDVLSHKLYGTTEFYWTFYLMNDNIRQTGWPVNYKDLVKFVIKKYPNTNLVTRDYFFDKLLIGETVEGVSSGTTGVVVKRDVNLGHIIIEGTKAFTAGETIQKQGDSTKSITLHSSSAEHLATRHHINGSSEIVDIDPSVGPGGLITPVSHLDHYRNLNDANRKIRVLTSDNIVTISAQFGRALKEFS